MEIALIAIQVCELMKYPYLNIGFKKKKKKKKKKTKTKKKREKIPLWLTFSICCFSDVCRLYYYYKWATTRQNVSSGVSDQARHKPACAATEAS